MGSKIQGKKGEFLKLRGWWSSFSSFWCLFFPLLFPSLVLHACTIACKAEHQIPVGVNRCWVKTVEKGTFPDTRRFFFPVLCNQCEEAPCVRICPTNALFKRRDGIVDLNGAVVHRLPRVHGGLPVRSAVHRSEHAHRGEVQLLREPRREPAAAGVRERLPDRVPHLRRPRRSGERGRADRAARGVHGPQAGKGTGPKVFYLGAEESAIRPEVAVRPFIFKEGQVHLRPLGAPDAGSGATRRSARRLRRPHGKPWGIDMVLYLLFKGISTGAMLLGGALLWWLGFDGPLTTIAAPAISLVFISLTAVVLVVDLERPERFYYILTRPNWRSWMVWGAWFLTAHGALAAVWLAAGWFVAGRRPRRAGAAGDRSSRSLATSYTGFLFAQGLARDLWQGPSAAIDLIAQSVAPGAAALLLIAVDGAVAG